jgi:hypothetical protein
VYLSSTLDSKISPTEVSVFFGVGNSKGSFAIS